MAETERRAGSLDHTVTATDVEYAVRLAVTALRAGEALDWSVKAGSLEWDCWETAEHLADDLFAYAVQLSPDRPPLETHVPFAFARQRPEGPANAVAADRSAGVAGLLQVIESAGSLLAATVRTKPSTVRAHHVFGNADPEGFAAMGVLETLVHTHDIAEGLGLPWNPDPALCDRVLRRLLPDAPADTDRWTTLLWCTGRAELPGRARLTEWRWYGEPRATVRQRLARSGHYLKLSGEIAAAGAIGTLAVSLVTTGDHLYAALVTLGAGTFVRDAVRRVRARAAL
ncbi:hypothetical protein ABT354_12320 [Streptomyces sp. NPDC000594]|uniref:hypothetical protein n=1 Tax=Streptomyces sp. NPDC000594 TaxID=3154261 RepID=UPI0033289694